MKIECNSLEKTKEIATAFSKSIDKKGAFITLQGKIGVGKTTFTRFLLKALGVTKNVTSPSFVILNEYVVDDLPIYHFDLYRLENSGFKSIAPEFLEYSQTGMLTLVEWAEFAPEYLPKDRIDINISYGNIQKNLDSRVFEFNANGKYMENIIKKTQKELKECV